MLSLLSSIVILIILGTLSFITSILIAYYPHLFMNVLFYITSVAILIKIIYDIFISIVYYRYKSILRYIFIIGEILVVVLFILYPFIFKYFLAILFSLYFSFMFAVKVLECYAHLVNKSLKVILTIGELLTILWGFITFFTIKDNREYFLLYVIASYIMFSGVMYIIESIQRIIKKKRPNILVSHLTINDIVGMILPFQILLWAKMAKKSNSHMLSSILDEDSLYNKECDLQVLFHLSLNGVGMGGHCELVYKGKTITFGNYNYESHQFKGLLGKGIITRADSKKYIEWITTSHKKTVISYGIQLNQYQKELLEKRIALYEKGNKWITPYQKDGCQDITLYKDYGSRLYYKADAVFYEIENHNFKKYYIASINCVNITNDFLSHAKICNLIMPGLATPGAFLELFEKEYVTHKGFVVSKKIYLGK